MKFRALLVASSIAAVATLALTSQLPSRGALADGGALEEAMEELKGEMRGLREALSNKDPMPAIEIVAKMQKSAMKAKGEVPEKVQQAEGKAREKMTQEFRVQMIDLTTELLQMEKFLVMGDSKKAAGSFKKLGQMQKKGHDRFREKKGAR